MQHRFEQMIRSLPVLEPPESIIDSVMARIERDRKRKGRVRISLGILGIIVLGIFFVQVF